jgi:hypothetical protein
MIRMCLPTVAILCLSGVALLEGQTSDPGWKPTLGEAFPFTVENGRVILTESVLVTPLQVLPAGTLARNVFTVPDTKAVERATKIKKSSELEDRYAGKRTKISAIDPEADPRNNFEKAVDLLALEEAWTQVEKFAAFFHIAPADSYMFAYQANAEAPPQVVQFRLPERLLLTEKDGVVRIRSVGIGSAADRAGLTPGAELVRVGKTDLQGSLQQFIKAYPKEKEEAQLAGHPLSVAYRLAGQTELKTAELRVPISLKSKAGLFDEIPLDSKPAPKKENPAEPGNPLIESTPLPPATP